MDLEGHEINRDMTPKEKAKELYRKIYSIPIIERNKKYHYHVGDVVKDCADRLKDGEDPFKKILLCVVDEVISNVDATILYHKESVALPLNKDYWQEVKKELECL